MKRVLKKVLPLILSAAVVLQGFWAFAARSILFGDLDEDGKISAADARAALRFSVGLEYYTEGHLKIGDSNGDGKIGASDARMILRISVGLESSENETVTVSEEDFEVFINKPAVDEIFMWEVPDAPEINAESGTFTFTVYGYGHGVGLSQYGALSLEDAEYTYGEILSHYYTGTEVKLFEEIPEMTVYPTYEYDEELGKETWIQKEHPTEELLARIVYLEIYGATENGKYEEALKAMTLCVFTNLAYYGFDISSRWDVGIASSLSYEQLPQNLKDLVHEVVGQYITVKEKTEPIKAVYSALSAGMTASCQSIWGGEISYLVPVPSPFDMHRDGFITLCTYTVEEMRSLITSYDSSIVLSDDPSEWLMILEHTGAMDETRGYVTKIRVGNRELKGYNQFLMGLMNNTLRSACFTITYTP